MAFLARMQMRSYNTELARKPGTRSPCEDLSWPRGLRPQAEAKLSSLPKSVPMARHASGHCSDNCSGLRASDLYGARSGSAAFLRFWRNPFAFFRFAIPHRDTTGNSGRIL
jgi:hypothetical protein